MPHEETHLDKAKRMLTSGLSPQTVRTTATTLWDLSPDEADKLLKKTVRKLALEATAIDTLGELMLTYRCQQNLLDQMARQQHRDDLPASFFNTQRHLLNDCRNTMVSIDTTRKEAGRDKSKHPEKAKERAEEVEVYREIQYRNTESCRDQGYFYDTRHGIVQPGNNILSWEVAVRDIIRMRMLPKSPHEDYIIAQMLDALTEEEKKYNPDHLSKDTVETDLHTWDPKRFAVPGMTKYKEESLLAQRLFLERIQEYNKIWADAEKHVDGLLAAKGLKPGMHFPYIGVPPVIRKAAEGDPEAIAEVKIAITSADQMEADWGKPWAIDITQKQPLIDPTGMNFGKSLGYIVTLLLAFTSAWTCLCLVVGPHYFVAEVVRLQSDDETPIASSELSRVQLPDQFVLPNHLVAEVVRLQNDDMTPNASSELSRVQLPSHFVHQRPPDPFFPGISSVIPSSG